MLKSLLSCLCVSVIGVGIVCAAPVEKPAEFKVNLTDVAKLKEIQSKLTEDQKKVYNNQINALIALADKDDTKISYIEFKKIVTDCNYSVPQLIAKVSRFRKFKKDVFADGDYKDDGTVNTLIAFSVTHKDPVKFRRHFFVNKKLTSVVKRYNLLKRVIHQYEKYIPQYSNTDIISDLQFAKKLIYPKIGEDEKWKTIAVKIELLIKSAQ